MVCIYCGGETGVSNSRPQQKNNHIWRRRRCKSCGATFSTQEAAQYELAWQVRSGKALEPFSERKLFMSLYKSCEHRKTALGDAQGLTDTVIRKLQDIGVNGALDARDIARIIQVALNRFDKAASIHYQAFHKS